MLVDNFEKKYFQSCVLDARNNYKSAQSQINSVITSKNEVMKIFRGFCVFEYALCEKVKNGKCRKLPESILDKKHQLLTVVITRKLLKSHQFVISVPF